jgi:hypothetical protein
MLVGVSDVSLLSYLYLPSACPLTFPLFLNIKVDHKKSQYHYVRRSVQREPIVLPFSLDDTHSIDYPLHRDSTESCL